ncbi:MAG: hypothetical protein IPN14_14355 [Bacteroidetes bacterium]|nr:hypothetical protein [Bacteroidota bacterium]
MKKLLLFFILVYSTKLFAQPAATYSFITNNVTPIQTLVTPTTLIGAVMMM